jgi:hypothetical protein
VTDRRWSRADLARLATEVRTDELGLTEFERFCPYRLAELYGIRVHPVTALAEVGCPPTTVDFFTRDRPDAWSAALVPVGTGHLILENDTHSPRRRRSNVAHELAHLLLEHEVEGILLVEGARGCRTPVDRRREEEATELAGELLLPAPAARRAAARRRSDAQVAAEFGVSLAFARWRMNVTGARIIAGRAAERRARQLQSPRHATPEGPPRPRR